jgi:quercetin dioxygenase-like cupin family protein
MRRALITLCLLVSVSLWAQQPTAPVELTSESSHHLVIENIFVRAFAVTVAPKQSTAMHRHGKDYLTVALGDSEILNVKEGAQPVPVKFKDGDVRFAPGGLVHLVTNSSDSVTFRNITIELMQPTTNQHACTESCAVPVPCDSADKTACTTVTKVFQSDQWSVTLITMPPGASYPKHTHLANFLVVPLTDGDVKAREQDGPETPGHYKAGEVSWHNPIVHSMVNGGSKPVRAVVLEFRGRPAGEGSESMGPDSKPGDHKPHDHH